MTAIISHIACDVALYKMALTSTVYRFFRDMNVLGAELHFQNRENFEEVLIEILIKNLKIKYFLCIYVLKNINVALQACDKIFSDEFLVFQNLANEMETQTSEGLWSSWIRWLSFNTCTRAFTYSSCKMFSTPFEFFSNWSWIFQFLIFA